MNSCPDSITIIIKPTNNCNLRCKHCYHAEKGYNEDVMSSEVLEKSISSVLPYYRRVTYIWHGGEPLTLPLSFYDKVLELQEKYKKDEKQEIKNLMQTNGTLITDEVARYIKEKKFEVGVSFDGPYNDEVRGLTEQTLQGYENLQKYGLRKGALTVIGNHNVDKLEEIYKYYKEKGMSVKLSPIFESGSAKENNLFLTDSDKFIKNMSRLFDIWARDNECQIGVTPLEEYVNIILFNRNKCCTYSDCTYKWLSIDCKGDIYPCGRAYPEEYNFGNVLDHDDIRQAFASDKYQELVRKAEIRRAKCKETCEIYNYCEGGCNNDAILENGLENIQGFSCETNKKILIHVKNRLNQLKHEMLTGRPDPQLLRRGQQPPDGRPEMQGGRPGGPGMQRRPEMGERPAHGDRMPPGAAGGMRPQQGNARPNVRINRFLHRQIMEALIRHRF